VRGFRWQLLSHFEANGSKPTRIAQLKIQNFRSIETADLVLPKQVVFVGDNNSGKSTILEAIDLDQKKVSGAELANQATFFGHTLGLGVST